MEPWWEVRYDKVQDLVGICEVMGQGSWVMRWQFLEFHAFYFYPVPHTVMFLSSKSILPVLGFWRFLSLFSQINKTPNPLSLTGITLTVGICSSTPWFCYQISDNKQFERGSVSFPHSLGGRPMGMGSPDRTGGSCPHFNHRQEERARRARALGLSSLLPVLIRSFPGSDATHSWGESVPFNGPNLETPPQACPEVCFYGDFKFHQI